MFTLNEKSRGIKIAWFFLIITIGSFLNELSTVSQTSEKASYELGYVIGGKLGLITLLGIGMTLYRRTKRRRFEKPVWGPKILDYILVLILAINFIFPLLSGRWVDGSNDDVLSFFYVTASLLAYIYATFAKLKVQKTISTPEA